MAQWPSFTWDASARQYRASDGRFVPRRQVRQALDESIEIAKGRISTDARALQAGAINLPEWQIRTEKNLKAIHVMSAAVAAGGWAQATARDWSRAANRLKKQYRFLDRFARQIESGEQPLDGRFLVRAESYAVAGSGTYEAVLRRIDLATGLVTQERRLLHSANPCTSCLGYHALGWQPPDTLPEIGEDCECGMRCQCTFERRVKKGEGRKRPPAAAVAGLGPAPAAPSPMAARAFAPLSVAPAPAPLPDVAAAPPGPPSSAARILPDRPIAERIAAYTDGQDRVRRLQEIGSDLHRLRIGRDRLRAELEAATAAHAALRAGPEKRAALAARKALETRLDEANIAFFREERAVRERAQDILKAPGRLDVGLYPGAAEKLSDEMFGSVAEGLRWLQRNMAHPEGAAGTLRVNAIPCPPQLAQRSACGPAFMWLGAGVAPQTFAHEMGHHFDYHVPGFKETSTAFLEHRVGDEPIRPLNEVIKGRGKFGRDEAGRKDRFGTAFGDDDAWYVGKHYDRGETEITAMGIERMFIDPTGFAHADPEYATLILGLMHGPLR